jgi:NTP pyrophosphatase (non-canonical NTP hydrolase)
MKDATGKAMDLQQLVTDVCRVHDVHVRTKGVRPDAAWYLLKVVEELGELTQAYLRKTRGTASSSGLEGTDKACAVECADVLCHVLLFAEKSGIDIVEAIREKWLSYL